MIMTMPASMIKVAPRASVVQAVPEQSSPKE
jgi:hypothetical protein